jgi:hypothetical protein
MYIEARRVSRLKILSGDCEDGPDMGGVTRRWYPEGDDKPSYGSMEIPGDDRMDPGESRLTKSNPYSERHPEESRTSITSRR